jgi:hypothetical protein
MSFPDDPDRPDPSLAETIACPMCHRDVPANQTARIGGRVVCWGCAANWFADDEDNGGE